MKPFTEEDLIAYHLSELSWWKAKHLHRRLKVDAELAEESAEIAATLRMFSSHPVPVASEAAQERSWHRVRRSLSVLDTPPRSRQAWIWVTVSVSAVAVIAIVAAAILNMHTVQPSMGIAENSGSLPQNWSQRLLGELRRDKPDAEPYNHRPGPLTTAPVYAVAEDPGLAAHIDAAERALTEVSHADGPLQPETREQVHRLLLDNAVYRESAEQHGDMETATVIDELGRVLTSLDAEPQNVDRKHVMTHRAAATSSLLTLLGTPLFAPPAVTTIDSAPTTAAFDVADVHPSAFFRDSWGIGQGISPQMQGGDFSGDRYILRQAAMTQLIATAYNLEPANVQGGPSWLDWDRFDIEAKAPPTTSKETIRLMLQSLLAQRFGLVVHAGVAPMPVYMLTARNGKTKLKESDGTGDSGCKSQPQRVPPTADSIPQIALSCHNETMEQFVEFLRTIGNATVGDTVKLIIDSTGLKEAYDFDLKWTPPQLLARAGSDGISIFDAVDKQLGLKLTLGTAPQPVLIVDSVNEAPTPNAPDLTKRMPPLPPAKLEVAVIKPSKPDERISSTLRGDEQDWQAITIKDHIRNVFDINYHDDDSLVGAPKWLGEERFDILAKLPSNDVAGATSKGPQALQQEYRQMLRTLIEDRFKMKYHWENRPVTAYHLVAVNPKLTPADPKARTRCDEGPGPDGKDPRLTNMALNRLVTCQNMSMAQFGVLLQYLAPDYIFSPALDDTGLEGSYNFTLSFSSSGLLMAHGPVGSSPPDGAQQAAEPIVTISLADAVKDQLGLKLEKQKRPLPVLVIDHIEEPTAN